MDHHWQDTTKYLEIRSTESGRQIVRQQWIAYPGESNLESSIALRDESLQWTNSGPECPRDENLQGILNLSPPTAFSSDFASDGWIAKPESTAVAFVQGLLRYMGIEPESTSLKQEAD